MTDRDASLSGLPLRDRGVGKGWIPRPEPAIPLPRADTDGSLSGVVKAPSPPAPPAPAGKPTSPPLR